MNRTIVTMCWIAGVALVLMFVRVLVQNRNLAAQLEDFYRAIELPAGARVRPLVGFGRKGQRLIIDSAEEDQPVLVLVFSQGCPACDDNWPNWDALIGVQRRRGGKIVPVDINGMARDDYLRGHGIASIPVFDSISPETAMSYRFRFTPQTIVLHRGVVAGGWVGILNEAATSRAAELLGGSLAANQLDGTTQKDPTTIQPFCNGLRCRSQKGCGSRCTCEGYGEGKLGVCVAKPVG